MIRAALGVVGVLLLLAGAWYFYHASGTASSTTDTANAKSPTDAPRQALGLPPLPGFESSRTPGNETPGTSAANNNPAWTNPAPVNPDSPTYQNPTETARPVVHSAGGTTDRPFNPAAIEPAPAPTRATSYTVQSGDSLWSISKKQYGSSKYIDQLAQANGITAKQGLKIGQTLTIPDLKTTARAPVPAHERDADCESDNGNVRRVQNTPTPPATTTNPPNNMPPTLSRPFRVEQPHR